MQVFLFSWQVLDCFCNLASEDMQCHFHHTLLVTRKSSLHVFKEREVRLLLLMARWKWQGSRKPNGMRDNVIRIGEYDLLQPIVWPQMYIYMCVFLLLAKYIHSHPRCLKRLISLYPTDQNFTFKLGPSIDETPWGHLLNFSSFSVVLILNICELNRKVIYHHSAGDNPRTTVTDTSIQKGGAQEATPAHGP